MSLAKAVYDALSGSSAVTALVGTEIARRHPGKTPSLPSITFQIVGDVPVDVDAMWQGRVQVDAWAEDEDTLDALEPAIYAALHRKPLSSSSRRIVNCICDGGHTRQFEDQGDGTPVFRSLTEFTISSFNE